VTPRELRRAGYKFIDLPPQEAESAVIVTTADIDIPN